MAGLDDMHRQLDAKVAKVADTVARQVERELKGDAPVDTGTLRSLIRAVARATATGATIDIESNADYAEFVREHRQEWDATIRRLPSMIERAWRAQR